ncbi:MAG: hypothetical protein ACOC1V_03445 [Candidatus Saliniplasma sp.]
MRKKIIVLIIVAVLLLSINTVYAHVPIVTDGNDSLEDAAHVHDPTKSWAIYSELPHKTIHYYEMEFQEGDKLRAVLYLPDRSDFVPDLVIMGPGMDGDGELNERVEVPEDYGYIIEKGDLDEAEYEPFTPASYYYIAEYDWEVDVEGTYYIAVYDVDGEHGNYGLAVGAEERYGILEWINVPLDIVKIRMWEGQNLLEVFVPMLITIAAGLSIFALKKDDGWSPNNINGWLLSFGGLLYVGSGTIILYQMMKASLAANPGAAVILTLMFALIPILVGSLLIFKGVKLYEVLDKKEKVKLVVYGFIGFFAWAGLIIGPIIVILSAVLPEKTGFD